jgi:hypothetical protein
VQKGLGAWSAAQECSVRKKTTSGGVIVIDTRLVGSVNNFFWNGIGRASRHTLEPLRRKSVHSP